MKKFNDAVRKLVKDDQTDVVVRGGRPVLRVPASVFFPFGEATLKPEGKTLLTQIVQALDGQMDTFELRVETFTDGGGEKPPSKDDAPKSDDKKAPPAPSPWELTGARAGALAKYLREQTPLPFQSVLVTPRGDFQPVVSGGEGHARNRRVEITITPLPVPFHAPPDAAHAADDHGKAKDSPVTSTVKLHWPDKEAAPKPKKAPEQD